MTWLVFVLIRCWCAGDGPGLGTCMGAEPNPVCIWCVGTDPMVDCCRCMSPVVGPIDCCCAGTTPGPFWWWWVGLTRSVTSNERFAQAWEGAAGTFARRGRRSSASLRGFGFVLTSCQHEPGDLGSAWWGPLRRRPHRTGLRCARMQWWAVSHPYGVAPAWQAYGRVSPPPSRHLTTNH